MRYLASVDDEDEDVALEDMIEDRCGGILVSEEALELIDPRQGQAVSKLLMAFDLPADMLASSQLMILSSFFDPDTKVRSTGEGNRKSYLEEAKALIDAMLEELK